MQLCLACGQAAFPRDVTEEVGETVIFRLFQAVGDCSDQTQRGGRRDAALHRKRVPGAPAMGTLTLHLPISHAGGSQGGVKQWVQR